MAIFDSTFRDYVMGAPSPVRDVSGAPPEHDAAMMDAYAGALGLLDSAEREHADAQARGDAMAAQSAAQRAQHARAQLDNLTTAYSKRGAGNAHEAARMATTPHQPMQSRPSVPTGKDRTSSAGAATEEGDPFRQWLESQGLSGGISSAGQGGRSRDYMEEMQQILMAYGGMGYSPSFAGEGIAAQGERAGMSDALRAQEAENNAARTQAYLQSQERQAETGALRLEGEEKKRAAAEARFGRAQSEVERHNKAQEDAAKAAAAARAQAAAAARAAKSEKEAEKAGKKAVEGLSVDWEPVEGANPTKQQNQEFTSIYSTDNRVRGLTQMVREGLKDAGAGRVMPGPARESLRQLATMLQIEGKDVAGLGALSGPDMALMNAIVADPTRIDSFMKDLPATISNVEKWSGNRVNAMANSVGYRKRGGKTPASVGEAPALVKVRQKSTGKTKTLKAEDARKFLANPDFEEAR